MSEKQETSKENSDISYLQWKNVSNSLKFLYSPHRVIAAGLLLFSLLYLVPEEPANRLWFVTAISVILLATFLQDGPLIRPHPFFWRLLLALVIIVILVIISLCMFERKIIVDSLSVLFPNTAGSVKPDRDYSMGCTIYDKSRPDDPFHNVKPVIFDVFVPAHFFGWIMQALILRNTNLCWTISILFEVCERMLKHWFPNFSECWWDSVILDVLVCNGLGIFIGMKLVNYLAFKTWDKRLYDNVKPNEKIGRMLKQFTPRSYTRYDWKPLQSPRRYFVYVFIIVSLLTLEVDLFGLKMVLSLTPKNPVVIFLMCMHLVVGMPAVLEYYMYAVGDRDSIGYFGSACVMLIISELCLTIKCGDHYFDAPTPKHVKIITLSILVAVLTFPIVWFGILKKGKDEEEKEKEE